MLVRIILDSSQHLGLFETRCNMCCDEDAWCKWICEIMYCNHFGINLDMYRNRYFCTDRRKNKQEAARQIDYSKKAALYSSTGKKTNRTVF